MKTTTKNLLEQYPLLHLIWLNKFVYKENVLTSIFFKAECLAHGGWSGRNDILSSAHELNTVIY